MAWSIVQSKTSTDSGLGTTASVTLDSSPTPDNYLVAFVSTGNSGAISGSGWTAYTSVNTGSLGSARSSRFFARKVVGGDGQSYSFTWSGSGRWMVSIFEVSGLDTTTVLDVEDAQATTSAANHSTPAVDPTDGAERLVFLGFAAKSQSSWSGQTLTSPSTIAATEQTDVQTSQNCHSVATVDQPSIAAGSYVGRGTVASADVGGAHILILRVAAAAAGGGTAPPPRRRPLRVWVRRRAA